MSISSLVKISDTTGIQPDARLSDYLSAIAAHIPTEILTLYTMALGFIVSDKPVKDETGQLVTPTLPMTWFYVFLAATPVFVWLINAVHSKEAQRAYLPVRSWPWWKATSATIAFAVWSAALPKSAFSHASWYSPSACAVILILVALVMPLIDKLVTE